MKLLIINGSARVKQRSEKVTAWVLENAKASDQFEAVELAPVNDQGFSFQLPNLFDGGPNYDDPATKAWTDKVASADAFIFVTPEYNHSYPSSLKTAIDYALKEWHHKPVGIVAHGGAPGGARAIEALLPVLRAVQLVPLNADIRLRNYEGDLDEQGEVANEKAGDALQKLLVTLAAYAEGLEITRRKLKAIS